MFPQRANGLPDILIKSVCEKAKSLVGVPYHHQGRNQEHGLDCIGLVLAALSVTGIQFSIPQNYTRNPRPKLIFENIERYCDKVESGIEPADILVMRLYKQPQHLGVYVGSNEIVHSYLEAGKVVIHEITPYFKTRIYSVYRLKSDVDIIRN